MHHGVSIIGYTDLPSRLANQSSQLYATNLRHLLTDMCKEKNGVINIDMDDEAVRGATVIKAGAITWPPPPPRLSAAPAKPAEKKAPPAHGHGVPEASVQGLAVAFGLGALALFGLGLVAPASFMAHFTVFVLACFVGYMVIWNVTPALHTPLMSVTNAISSIIIIGALVQIAPPLLVEAGVGRPDAAIRWLAVIGIGLTAINMFGGFAVTGRMLAMFRK